MALVAMCDGISSSQGLACTTTNLTIDTSPIPRAIDFSLCCSLRNHSGRRRETKLLRETFIEKVRRTEERARAHNVRLVFVFVFVKHRHGSGGLKIF